MQQQTRVFLAVIFVAVIVGAFLVQVRMPAGELAEPEEARVVLPDLSEVVVAEVRKELFVDFLRPLVEYQNQQILAEREQVVGWHRTLDTRGRLSASQRRSLRQLAKRYRLDPEGRADAQLLERLLRRVDAVPVSLALSQAANESAWGTSRFAVEGNNLFGQWCFRRDCGMVPVQRPEGARHEVAAFESPLRSVQSYMHNLNTHNAYQSFREMRARMRQEGEPLDSLLLAEGLLRYSTRGEEYVREVQAMIRFNDLQRFDS